MKFLIKKLELVLDEESLTELILQENKEQYEKEKIYDFKIHIKDGKLIITGKKQFAFLGINFQLKGNLSLKENNFLQFEVEKVKAASFIPIPPRQLVKEMLAADQPGVYPVEGNDQSILIDPFAKVPYPLDVQLQSLEILDGKLLFKSE